VNSEVRPIYRDECFAKIAKGGFFDAAEVRFSHEDPHQAIVKLTQRMRTDGAVAHAPLRLFG